MSLWLAKDYIKKALNRWDLDGKYWARESLKEIEEAEAETKRLKEENRWIPVGERLPELEKAGEEGGLMSDWVHITDGEKVIDAYYYDFTKREAKPNYAIGKGWYCHGMKKSEITHWKPIILPKP